MVSIVNIILNVFESDISWTCIMSNHRVPGTGHCDLIRKSLLIVSMLLFGKSVAKGEFLPDPELTNNQHTI